MCQLSAASCTADQGHCSCALSDLLCSGLHVLHVVCHRDVTELSA